jgi:hypothetical protein
MCSIGSRGIISYPTNAITLGFLKNTSQQISSLAVVDAR